MHRSGRSKLGTAATCTLELPTDMKIREDPLRVFKPIEHEGKSHSKFVKSVGFIVEWSE